MLLNKTIECIFHHPEQKRIGVNSGHEEKAKENNKLAPLKLISNRPEQTG